MSYQNGPRIATSGLVLYLDAGNSKSYPGTGTAWNDLSGNGNNGTLTNGPNYNSVRNGTIVLDGTNDYIVKDSLASFNVYCISIWVRPAYLINSTSASSSLIQLRYQAAAGNYAWYIGLGPNTILLTDEYLTILNVQNNGRIGLTDGGSLLANTWYNLVFNYESTEYKFYINGINKVTTAYSPNVALLTNPNKLYIGAVDGDGSSVRSFFNGTIGQVSLYNRALSASEILNNYNALKGRYASYLTDSDAIRYVAAVEAADGQELERSVALAYENFIVGCKADNIWSAIKASCILAGARTLSGALIPLAGSAPTNNSIVSADYNRKTGIKLDGSTKTLNANIAPSANPQNDAHYSVFLTEVNTANPAYILAANDGSNVGMAQLFDGGALQVGINGGTIYNGANEQANKLIGASRNASNTFTFRVNGGNTSIGSTSQAPTSANYLIGGQLNANVVWKSNARYMFYSIGTSLDLAKLDTRVSALYTAIGAAIP